VLLSAGLLAFSVSLRIFASSVSLRYLFSFFWASLPSCLRDPYMSILLLFDFLASSSRSNTTTDTCPLAAADSAPAPPPRRKYPERRYPGGALRCAPAFHTSATDLAAPVALRYEFPATQNPSASLARCKLDLPTAVYWLLAFTFAPHVQLPLEISLTSFIDRARLV